jgi:glycosyltransferase involved in cell wall biosynthesis
VQPLVSVVVAVHNVARYLPQCIDSLISQTLREVEVILVNDRSTDNSLDILLDYQARHPDTVVVIDSPTHRRQGGAWNLGIRQARGEYVSFVGGDDWVDETTFEKLYAKAVATNSDLVRAFVDEFNEIPGELGHSETGNVEIADDLEGRPLTDADRESLLVNGAVWCQLLRRALFVENDLWFPEHLAAQDNFVNKLMLFYVERFAIVREHLYHYRIHSNSTMNTRNAPWRFDRLRIECMVLDEVETRGLGGRLDDALEYQFVRMYFWNTIQLWEKRSDGAFPREVLREMQSEMKRRTPHFRSNVYYRREFSRRDRLLIDIVLVSPEAYRVVAYLFRRSDRVVQYLVRMLRKNDTIYAAIRGIYRRLHGTT